MARKTYLERADAISKALQKLAEDLAPYDRTLGVDMELSRTLDNIVQSAAVLSTQAAYRTTHTPRLARMMETRRRQIRRVLGYTYP